MNHLLDIHFEINSAETSNHLHATPLLCANHALLTLAQESKIQAIYIHRAFIYKVKLRSHFLWISKLATMLQVPDKQ